jgi:diguanylate cyclase (GGDEF)-like protein
MLTPKKPKNEHVRLEALRSLNILDTCEQEHFDRVTRTAKRLFNVSISLISLIDDDRQWFKSCAGIDVKETPRDISFCGHAILDDKPFIIEDASKDLRFADNPLVIGSPNIRFYAGYPLKDVNGYKLGTLCIIDSIPKTLSDEDILAFKDLAGIVEDELAALQLATFDELTNISNRRGFVELAKYAITLGVRQQTETYLAYFDLNNFKEINDNFGHDAGDKVLICFATQLKKTFRKSDIYARLGGDEFVVLLTNTNKKLALDAISRLTKNLHKINTQENLPYPVSFSQGLVKYDETLHQNIDSFLQEADQLMFQDKRNNRY